MRDLSGMVTNAAWSVQRVVAAAAFVSELTGESAADVRARVAELDAAGLHHPKEELLYLLVRSLRPFRVVETGVCEGWSSHAILLALNANDRGSLVSIDLPTLGVGRPNADGRFDGAHVAQARDTGRLVPAYLTKRWSLRLGPSRDLLPTALAEGCDLFVHDSDHSDENMRFELSSAYLRLRDNLCGGVVYSDDIEWSGAFKQLAAFVRITDGNRAALLRLGAGPHRVGGFAVGDRHVRSMICVPDGVT